MSDPAAGLDDKVAHCTQGGNTPALLHSGLSWTRCHCKSQYSLPQPKAENLFKIQVLMNTILFWRILSVDFSGMFRSASFTPRDATNKVDNNTGEGLGNYLKNVLQEEDKYGNAKPSQE